MSPRSRRPAVRRALTAALAGAALCHGGAAAGAEATAQDSPEVPTASPTPDASPTASPTPDASPTASPTPDASPTPTPTPTPEPEPTPVASPVADAPSGEDPPADAQPVHAEPEAAVPSSSPVPTPLPAPTAEPTPAAAPAPPPAAHDRARPRVREGDDHARAHGIRRRPAGEPAPTPTPAAAPAPASPRLTVVMPGAVPIGVPDFFIDRFRIPPFLLPIYQAAGTEYGVRWEVLAAINEIETDYGRNLAVSKAGATGWMQFMPSTWRLYGVDANGDGVKDPYNPFDAIFAAARYLRAAGADRDIRQAIFAYNHADWYVDSVLLRARVIGGMPSDLVGSLSGLVEGRFPVRARASYASRLDRGVPAGDPRPTARLAGPSARPRSIRILARAGAPVVAVHDARVAATGHSGRFGRYVTLRDAYGNRFAYGHLAAVPGAVRPRARVPGGAVIGRVAAGRGAASHLSFRVRPAGRGAPWIDPTPLLDGWKLLGSTAIYRAAGRSRLFGAGAEAPTVGQVLLMSKGALARHVLADPRLDIYGCGRRDIEAGVIDRRVLATLAFLSASGLRPTVTSLRCGHGVFTSSGNVSEHSTGTAVDIAALNGIPIAGHQGAGSITELAIDRLLTLQGVMRPHQIISTMTFAGADNTFAMSDHADHIHIGWRPGYGTIKHVDATLRPQQWIRLIDRLGKIDNPVVSDPREDR
jgi:soluble lytic murein transglycosylase-like protein